MDGKVLQDRSSTGVLVTVSTDNACHICILQTMALTGHKYLLCNSSLDELPFLRNVIPTVYVRTQVD